MTDHDLANRLDEWDHFARVEGVDRLCDCDLCKDLRAAAARLRHLDALLNAIGDPEGLTFIAGRCLDEAVNIQRGAADPVTTIGALSEAAVVVQRIADAATNNQQEAT